MKIEILSLDSLLSVCGGRNGPLLPKGIDPTGLIGLIKKIFGN